MKIRSRAVAISALAAVVLGSSMGGVSAASGADAAGRTQGSRIDEAHTVDGDSSVMAKAVESLPNAGFSDAQLAEALEANGATNVRIRSGSSADPEARAMVTAAALPVNLFTVSISWADWIENGKKHIAAYGRWNYRDDVVGSGAPDDAAGLALSGFPAKCFENVGTGLQAQSSDGSVTPNSTYLKDAGQQKSVFGVRDRTRAFRLLTDMGFAWIEMKRKNTNCPGPRQGRFYHEHNQDGSGGWSASLSLSIFSLSYSSSGGQRLQKSTPVSTY